MMINDDCDDSRCQLEYSYTQEKNTSDIICTKQFNQDCYIRYVLYKITMFLNKQAIRLYKKSLI